MLVRVAEVLIGPGPTYLAIMPHTALFLLALLGTGVARDQDLASAQVSCGGSGTLLGCRPQTLYYAIKERRVGLPGILQDSAEPCRSPHRQPCNINTD